MRKACLSDAQWRKIEPLLPVEKSRGRPWADNRQVLEGILWVLKTGARWRALSEQYPSPATCWRRLARWEKQGVWLNIWRAFLSEQDARGTLDWEESFLDASFAPAKKRGECVSKTKRGKGTKWMVVVDGSGIPLGSQLASANPAEVTLAESTLKKVSVPQPRGRARSRPLRVIADRGYNSDPLRWRLLKRGILLITPHHKSRKKPSLNDGRTLATLSQTLENRTDFCLAWKLPSAARPS
jgi:transposase